MPDPVAALRALLPEGAVDTDPDGLREAAGDHWALALLREARGDAPPLPAAVAFPSSTEEVAAVLAWAAETGAPVVPRGLGSGVSGAAMAAEGCVVLDLSRMDRVLSVDPVSQAVEVQAGIRGDRLEGALAEHGLTTGHYPQSLALSSVGGWIAAASAGQASAGYGAIEDLLLGVTAALGDGTVLRLKPVPRTAAGPDLRRLLVGSEGTLAVVTEAVLACARRPPGWAWEALGLAEFAAILGLAREATQRDVGAFVVRGYDEPDAMLQFGPLGHPGGCVALFGFPEDLPGLEGRREALRSLAVGREATGLDPSYGAHWWEHRNDGAHLYRRIMGPERLFGPGTVVDTLEVAGLWRQVPELYAGIREALAARAEAVGCHLSHPYRAGASLYFTFLLRGRDEYDAEHAYLRTWDEALRRCLAAGGTVTHHHGVGLLKAAYMADELGAGAAQALRRIRQALDPGGILNPGKLLP